MNNFTKLSFLFATALCGLSAQAQNAEIAQIAPLQWKITWEDAHYIDPMNVIVDNPDYTAYITNLEEEVTYLQYKKQVVFPLSGNYFTVNLEGMGLPEGEYVLTIPESYIKLIPQYTPNETEYFNITIGGETEFTYEARFSEIDGNSFDISWENVTALAPGKTEGAYLVSVATDEKYDMLFLEDYNYSKANLRISGEFLKVNITNNYPDLPDGEYKLYIPADYVKFNGSETGNTAIEGFEFTYAAPWKEGSITAEGPDEEGYLSFTWDDAAKVVYNTEYAGDGFGTNGITIFDGADIQVDVKYPDNVSFMENVMTVNLNGLGLKSGQCQLVIPEECLIVTVNDEEGLTEGLVWRFNYVNPDDPIDPDEPTDPVYTEYAGEAAWSVAENSEIYTDSAPVEVSWNGNELAVVENIIENVSVFGNETGYKELTFGNEVTISESGTSLCIDLSGLEADTYRVNVPAGYVFIYSDGQTFVNAYTSLETVIVTGEAGGEEGAVAGIEAENGIYTVYNLQGVKVLESESLNGLSKGIYIINGKKTVVP